MLTYNSIETFLSNNTNIIGMTLDTMNSKIFDSMIGNKFYYGNFIIVVDNNSIIVNLIK